MLSCETKNTPDREIILPSCAVLHMEFWGAGSNSPLSIAPAHEAATSWMAVTRAGGTHTDIVVPQFGPMLDFFAAQAKPR